MKTFTDEGLYDDAKFEAWNDVLAPLGRLRCQGRLGSPGGGAGSELLEPLYDIAQEMRDRLRFSQLRMHQLKAEVRKMQGLLTMERQQAAEALTEERMQAQAAQLQVEEQLLCDKDKVQALLRQAQEELQREKEKAQALQWQAQEELQREKDKAQALQWQAQEELRSERARNQDTLDKQQRQAMEHLQAECKAAQDHAAAECRRAHEALRQAEEQLRQERTRGTDDRIQERQKAAAQLAELETHIRQLNQEARDQDSQLTSQQRLNSELQNEVATARYGTNASAAQLDEAEDRADRAEAARRNLAAEVTSLRLELEEWRRQASQSEGRHSSATQALLDTKRQLGELSHLQGLYLAAREELERLDKENSELKEMVQSEVYELSRSRILETMSPSRQEKSSPLYLTPELTGRRRPKSNRRQARSISPGRDRVHAATGVIYPPDLAANIEGLVGALRPPPPPHDGLGHVAEAAQLAQLAFLGPPTSAYPTDPDKFVFVRVAGGFSPKYIGSEPLPRASGWIPKEVVRLAQAFKHSHAINLEWRAWEPFLLLVNEVYHSVGGGGQYHGGQYGSGAYLKAGGRATRGGGGDATATVAYRPGSARTLTGGAAAATVQQELESPSSEGTRLYLSRMASYPAVVQAERIMALRRELAARPRSRGRAGGARTAREERERDSFLRTMAEKDYHILNELGEVVGENQRLRRSMHYTD